MECRKCKREFDPFTDTDMDTYYSYRAGLCRRCGVKGFGRRTNVERAKMTIGTPILMSKGKMDVVFDVNDTVIFTMEGEYGVSLKENEIRDLIGLLTDYLDKKGVKE